MEFTSFKMLHFKEKKYPINAVKQSLKLNNRFNNFSGCFIDWRTTYCKILTSYQIETH